MSDDTHPFDRPILFFGGKGGVGKTTLAAATAIDFAGDGLTTLLVSTDPAHSVSDILEMSVGNSPTAIADRLSAIEIDPEVEADRYIDDVKAQIGAITAPRLLAEVERQIDVARVSPGAEESALFERFARIIEDGGYDRIVFDTAPTGHTLRLLSLPELMTGWITGLIDQRKKHNLLGTMWRNVTPLAARAEPDDPVLASLTRRRDMFVRARRQLTDPIRTGFVFVVTPERLPVLETEKAVAVLDKWNIPIVAVVINRVLPDRDMGFYMESRRGREKEFLARIESSFQSHPLFKVPLFERDLSGMDDVKEALRAMTAVTGRLGK
ncbi:MAG: ArsA family ATPase [Gemmatimonadales bacterium]